MTEQESGSHIRENDNSTPDAADDRPAGDARRHAHRKRTLKAGYAVFGDSRMSVPCLVRDLSDSGARIRFENLQPTPSKFDLYIEIDGIKIPCEKVWTKGQECGVHFTGGPQKTRVSRNQVLGTSENALSNSWKSSATGDEERHNESADPSRSARRAAPGRTFGKRT